MITNVHTHTNTSTSHVTRVSCIDYLLMYSASKYGIYTLLDAHQDVLSQKFCGEGIPDWAVDTGCKTIVLFA